MKPAPYYCLAVAPVTAGGGAWVLTGSVLAGCCTALLLGAVLGCGALIARAVRHQRERAATAQSLRAPPAERVTLPLHEQQAWEKFLGDWAQEGQPLSRAQRMAAMLAGLGKSGGVR